MPSTPRGVKPSAIPPFLSMCSSGANCPVDFRYSSVPFSTFALSVVPCPCAFSTASPRFCLILSAISRSAALIRCPFSFCSSAISVATSSRAASRDALRSSAFISFGVFGSPPNTSMYASRCGFPYATFIANACSCRFGCFFLFPPSFTANPPLAFAYCRPLSKKPVFHGRPAFAARLSSAAARRRSTSAKNASMSRRFHASQNSFARSFTQFAWSIAAHFRFALYRRNFLASLGDSPSR